MCWIYIQIRDCHAGESKIQILPRSARPIRSKSEQPRVSKIMLAKCILTKNYSCFVIPSISVAVLDHCLDNDFFVLGAAVLPVQPLSLSLQSITHSFSDRAVLSNVNLDISEGEIISLVGPSGSGKTTLLKIIAGLERIQLGKITLDGKNFASASLHPAANERAIGFVFQDHVLFPNMTVEKNVGFGIRHKKSAERRSITDRLLDQVGLSDFGKRFPDTLSGGQKQRIALIRALAREPKYLLMDEPFASVDSPLRSQLIEDTRLNLKSENTSALVVTHDLDEAMKLGDRIVVLVDGQFVQVGTPEQIYERPGSSFIAEALFDLFVLPGKVEDKGKIKTGLGIVSVDMDKSDIAPGELVKLGFRNRDVSIDPRGTSCIVEDIRFVLGNFIVLIKSIETGESLSVAANKFHGLSVGQSASIKFATTKPYIYHN